MIVLDHPHHYIGVTLWGKIIFRRPAGIQEKVDEDLDVVGDSKIREIQIPPNYFGGENMDGVDGIEKLFNLLEENQHALVIK